MPFSQNLNEPALGTWEGAAKEVKNHPEKLHLPRLPFSHPSHCSHKSPFLTLLGCKYRIPTLAELKSGERLGEVQVRVASWAELTIQS